MKNGSMKDKHRWLAFLLVVGCFFAVSPAFAQNQILGEVAFSGKSKIEKTSGVWIDGQYVGYLGELKGDKKIMLLPGDHDLTVRQTGYQDFNEKIVVEPRMRLTVPVKMDKAADVVWPSVTSELKVDINPGRAAVFVDDKYVGHAGELGGARHAMLLSPGAHRVKVELPGYQTFESDVNLVAGQKSVVKTELVEGSINQAGNLVKEADNIDGNK